MAKDSKKIDKRYQREIVLTDKEIVAMALEKAKLVEQGRKLAQEQEELVKQHDAVTDKMRKLVNKINKLKLDKIIPKTKELSEKLLTEYEIPISTEEKEGRVVLLVEDVIKEFKTRFDGQDKWKTAVVSKKQK